MKGSSAILGSGAWVVSRIGAQGLEFVAWVLLARRLGAESVGLLAVAAIGGRLLGLVGDWGAAFRGPRDVVQRGRHSAAVVSLVRRREHVSALLALAMVAAVATTGHLNLIPIAAVVLGRGSGRDWIALGEGRRFAASIPLLLQSVLLVSLVLATNSVLGAATGIGVANLVGLAASVILNPVLSSATRSSAAVDGWYLLASVSDQILVSSDTALILIFRSATEAGIYASIYRLPLALLTVVGLVTTAAIPLVARSIQSGRHDLHDLHRKADRAALVGGLLVLPSAVVGLVVLGPLFGEEFTIGRDALLLLFVATGATIASAPYRILYVSLARDRPMALVTALVAGGNVVGNLVIIGPFGIEGAAMTTLLSQVAMLCFFVRWSISTRPTALTEPLSLDPPPRRTR